MQDTSSEEMSYRFTERELARLTAYRDAIRAGLYSEQSADANGGEWNGLLEPSTDPSPVEVLTPEELERLAAYRDAVAEGLFVD
jgi:hypothetical protein